MTPFSFWSSEPPKYTTPFSPKACLPPPNTYKHQKRPAIGLIETCTRSISDLYHKRAALHTRCTQARFCSHARISVHTCTHTHTHTFNSIPNTSSYYTAARDRKKQTTWTTPQTPPPPAHSASSSSFAPFTPRPPPQYPPIPAET